MGTPTVSRVRSTAGSERARIPMIQARLLAPGVLRRLWEVVDAGQDVRTQMWYLLQLLEGGLGGDDDASHRLWVDLLQELAARLAYGHWEAGPTSTPYLEAERHNPHRARTGAELAR